MAEATTARRGFGSGLRPLAVALSRLMRLPAVCGRFALQCYLLWAGFKDDMVTAALDRRDGPMPFGAEHWRMNDGAICHEGVLALVKFGKVALEGPARSGQLRLELFVPEAVLFINGQCLMGTKK